LSSSSTEMQATSRCMRVLSRMPRCRRTSSSSCLRSTGEVWADSFIGWRLLISSESTIGEDGRASDVHGGLSLIRTRSSKRRLLITPITSVTLAAWCPSTTSPVAVGTVAHIPPFAPRTPSRGYRGHRSYRLLQPPDELYGPPLESAEGCGAPLHSSLATSHSMLSAAPVATQAPPVSTMRHPSKTIEESRRADSNRLPLLITSVRSVVAGRCRGLQIPHKQRIFCSLHCPILQGVASGLGSN
jgi:hypothetical protein